MCAHEGTLEHTSDSMTEGPNYLSLERVHVFVHVCVTVREQSRGTEGKAKIENERQSACACM